MKQERISLLSLDLPFEGQKQAHVSLTAELRVREENEILHQAESQFFSLVCTRVSINMFVQVRPGVKHNLLEGPKVSQSKKTRRFTNRYK